MNCIFNANKMTFNWFSENEPYRAVGVRPTWVRLGIAVPCDSVYCKFCKVVHTFCLKMMLSDVWPSTCAVDLPLYSNDSHSHSAVALLDNV